jgi:hypothetical protein
MDLDTSMRHIIHSGYFPRYINRRMRLTQEEPRYYFYEYGTLNITYVEGGIYIEFYGNYYTYSTGEDGEVLFSTPLGSYSWLEITQEVSLYFTKVYISLTRHFNSMMASGVIHEGDFMLFCKKASLMRQDYRFKFRNTTFEVTHSPSQGILMKLVD